MASASLCQTTAPLICSGRLSMGLLVTVVSSLVSAMLNGLLSDAIIMVE